MRSEPSCGEFTTDRRFFTTSCSWKDSSFWKKNTDAEGFRVPTEKAPCTASTGTLRNIWHRAAHPKGDCSSFQIQHRNGAAIRANLTDWQPNGRTTMTRAPSATRGLQQKVGARIDRTVSSTRKDAPIVAQKESIRAFIMEVVAHRMERTIVGPSLLATWCGRKKPRRTSSNAGFCTTMDSGTTLDVFTFLRSQTTL